MKKRIISMLLAVVILLSLVPMTIFARNCENVTITNTKLWEDGSLKSMDVTFDWGAAGNEHLYVVVMDEHTESNSDSSEYWWQYDKYSHTDPYSIEKSITDFANYRGIGWYAYGGDGSTPVNGNNTINVLFDKGVVPLNVDRNYSFVMFNAPDGTDYRPTDPLGTLKCSSSTLSFENTSGSSADVKIEALSYPVINGSPKSDNEKNHGYIDVDKTTAKAGETVTIYVNPAEGYQLKSLTGIRYITIADILPDNFPSSEEESMTGGAWTAVLEEEQQAYCYLISGKNTLRFKNNENYKDINADSIVSQVGDNYVYTDGAVTVTFTVSDEKLNSITFEGKDNKTWDGTYSAPACVAAGTMVTMGNGEQKAIEKIEIGDVIRTVDHETGAVSSAPVCFLWETKKAANAFTLTFDEGVKVTVIEEHGFYNAEKKKYVFINAKNAPNYVGDHFYNADDGSWLALKSVETEKDFVDAYAIATSSHLNHLSNGMLSMCDGTVEKFANIFEHDIPLRIDAAQKEKDITENGGLTPLETVLKINGFNEADYNDYNLQYLNVAIGKGIFTWEWFAALGEYCAANDIYDSLPEPSKEAESPKKLLASAPVRMKMLAAAPNAKAPDDIEIKPNEAGNYVFTMPNYSVRISAEFEKMPAHNHGTGDDAVSFEKKWTDATKLPDTAGKYYLDTDVTLSEKWNVPAGTTDLCLKGHVIRLADDKVANVITISSNATLNLYDCDTETEHEGYVDADTLWHLGTGTGTTKKIKGGIITGGRKSGIVIDGGKLNMYGGNLAGNTENGNGGGVIIQKGAAFYMYGGTIENCTVTGSKNGEGMGGGVYVGDSESNIFTIDGGVIQNCFATRWGGGVANQGTMTILKGGIKNCTAGGAGGVNNDRILIMNGGFVENCKATGEGDTKWFSGGIRVANGKTNAKAVFGGDAKVINNTKYDGSPSNVHLASGKTVIIADGENAPTEKFNVGVTTQTAPEFGSPVSITANGSADDLKRFTSDNEDYMLTFNTNHLECAVIVAYNYTKHIKYATLTKAISEAVNGDEIEIWADENDEDVVLPAGVTLYAKYGYTGTVTTNEVGKSVAKQDMFGQFQYKFFVADTLTITYKDQGDKDFSGTHESGYPTTFVAEEPLELKSASKVNYTFDGWFDNPGCTGEPITGFYAYTYTDSVILYAKWTCNHTGVLTPVNGQPATKTASGWNDYYMCECGKYFEDSEGLIEITNFEDWKSEGGNGYIAKLEEEPEPPQTGDTGNMNPWVISLAISVMGLCAFLDFTKKRKKEQ